MLSGSLSDVVVLAGGAGRRLGGVDKPALYVGPATLLDRVLAALPPCGQVVVVGPPRPTVRPVLWTLESPPGGGPVAGLAAGLACVTAPQVLVLAGDLPFLTPALLSLLLGSLSGDGALMVDASGREQYLCSAWSSDALRRAVAGTQRMGDVVSSLSYARVSLPSDEAVALADCDTPEELQAARDRASWSSSAVSESP